MKQHLTRILRLAGVALVIAALLLPGAAGPRAAAANAQEPARPEKVAPGLPPGGLITESVPQTEDAVQAADEEPVVDETDYPRLESQLEQLYEAAVLGTGEPIDTLSGLRHIDLQAGTARVILEMTIDPEAHQAGPAWIETIDLGNGQTTQVEHAPPIAIRADLLSAVEAAGARYETAYQSLVQVLAPFGSLVALSEVPGVARVRLPYAARTQELPAPAGTTEASGTGGKPDVGTYTSEGVGLTNANSWISAGYDGAGVNLAVFDFGFTGYAALATSGDLPTVASGNLVLKDYSAYYSFSPDTSGYEHGAACAEIAHDMAPGARMYLYAFNTDVEFGNAMTNYETDAGITGKKTATMSIGWVNAGPYDGTGPIDTIVNTAANTYGIFFSTSAGNSQKSHDSFTASVYSGTYVSFGGQQYNVFGKDGSSCWSIPANYTIDIFLEWNDWQADRTGNVNGQDYDLYLYKCSTCISNCSQVASSTVRQCNNTANDPTEAISYTPLSAGYYRLAIQYYQTTGCTFTWGEWLDLYSWVNTGASNLWRHYNYCNSLGIPADADGAVATGATFWGEDGTSPAYGLEPFSSLGPRNASGGGSNGTTRAKIDVVAPDGTSTVTYGAANGTNYAGGGTGFWGTSGASPHVAGLAALVWHGNPTYTLAQVTSYVKTQASDRPLGSCGGSAGNCNTYGDGRINLGSPPATGGTWTGATSTDWNVGSNWSSGSVPSSACSGDVVIPTSPTGGRFPTLTATSYVRHLTIQTGATLNGGSQTLHVCGNWNNSGTGTFTGSTGTVNFNGTTVVSGGSTSNNFNNVTIASGRSLDLGASQTLNVSGNWTDNGGTVTPNSSSVTFKGTTQTAQKAGSSGTTYLLGPEGFASGVPAGWNVVNNGGSCVWLATNPDPGGDGNLTGGSGIFPDADSDSCGSGTTMNTELRTPAISLPSGQSSYLEFKYDYYFWASGEYAHVDIYADGAWTNLLSWTSAQRGPATRTIDLTSYAGKSVILRFHYFAPSWDYWWQVDDVSVYSTGTIPGTLAFNNLTVASGTRTTFKNDATLTGAYKLEDSAFHDMENHKISGGTSFSYLYGWLSNYETKSVSTSAVDFYDARNTGLTNPTARLTRASGTSDYTVTTRAGFYFPAGDFSTSCPNVNNAVLRYWNIVPASAASTTVRLYYLDTELNGNTESTLKIYHCIGSTWHEQTGTLTRDTSANWVQVMGVSDFSPFILTSGSPTSVDLKSFKAWPEAPAVHVQWETYHEVDNQGFNLYRSNTRSGPKVKLNQALIPTKVPPGSPFGAVYDWADTFRLRPGRRYFYWLEDVDVYGFATMHGPAVAVAP